MPGPDQRPDVGDGADRRDPAVADGDRLRVGPRHRHDPAALQDGLRGAHARTVTATAGANALAERFCGVLAAAAA